MFLVTRHQSFCRVATYLGDAGERVDLPPPAIMKPVALWTGKQVRPKSRQGSANYNAPFLRFFLIMVCFLTSDIHVLIANACKLGQRDLPRMLSKVVVNGSHLKCFSCEMFRLNHVCVPFRHECHRFHSRSPNICRSISFHCGILLQDQNDVLDSQLAVVRQMLRCWTANSHKKILPASSLSDHLLWCFAMEACGLK